MRATPDALTAMPLSGGGNVEGLPESVAHLLRALRPAGLWYGTLSAVVVLALWCLHEHAWADWPAPIRCATWTWLVATVFAVPYTHLIAAVTGWVEQRNVARLPVAHPPAALPATPTSADAADEPPAAASGT